MAKSKTSFFLKSILVLIVLILLFIGFLPMMVSSDLGNKAVIKITDKFTSKRLAFTKLSLSWSGPQEIENFLLMDDKGNSIASFNKLKSDWSPLHMIKRSKSFGKTMLDQPMLHLVIKEKEPSSSSSSIKEKYLPPKNKKGKKSSKTSYHIPYDIDLDITNGTIIIDSDVSGEATFTDVNLDLSTKKDSNSLDLKLSGNSVKESQKGQIDVSSVITLSDSKVSNILESMKIQGKCQIKKLPIPALEEVLFITRPENKGILKALFGPSLNSNIDVSAKGEDVNLAFDISSSNLSCSFSTQTEDGTLKLDKPGKISLDVSEGLLHTLSKDLPFSLPSSAPLAITIDSFSGPLSSLDTKSSFLAGFHLDASASISNLNLKDVPVCEQLSSESLKLSLKGPSLNELKFTTTAKLSSYKQKIKNYLGKAIEITVSGIPNFEDKILCNEFNFLGRSEKLSLSVLGALSKDEFKFTKPVSCTYVISPEILSQLSKPHLPKLKTPLSFRASIQSNDIDFEHPPWRNLKKLKASGKASIDNAMFQSPYTEAFEINEAQANFDIDNSTNNVQVVFNSKLERESIKDVMSLDGKVTLTNYLKGNKFSFDDARGFFYFNLPDLPTQLVGSYFGEAELFELLLGKSLNVSMHTSLQKLNENQGRLDFKAQSDTLDAYLEFQLGKALSLAKTPSYIKWKISPKAFASLYRLRKLPSDSLLLKEAEVDFNISKLHWPIDWKAKKASQYLDVDQLSTDFSLKSPKLSFGDLEKGRDTILKELNIDLSTKKLSEDLQFKVTSQTKSKSTGDSEGKNEGSISIKGALQNPTDLKHFAMNQLNVSLDGKLINFPTEGFTPIHFFSPRLDQFLESALGSEMNANFSAKLSQGEGPFDVKVTSYNGRASLKGKLENGFIFLSEDLAASMTLTPAVLKSLSLINPFLKDIVSAPQPIQLKIASKDTQIPVAKWEAKNFSLGSSQLDLGKIKISSKGEIVHLLNLLNFTPADKDIEAWFSILRFKVDKGAILCERTDTLLDRIIHFATWGSIDLKGEKVDMLLAITPGTLQRTLGANNIGDDAYLQIPIKGKIGNIKADWSQAATELAGMGIQKIFRNPIGDILGAAVSKVGSIQNEKVPPPPPLPWTEDDIRTKKPKEKPQDSPNQIDPSFQKDAKKSIESLFELFE